MNTVGLFEFWDFHIFHVFCTKFRTDQVLRESWGRMKTMNQKNEGKINNVESSLDMPVLPFPISNS